MKFKKLSAILIAVMILSLFSGCGKKDKGAVEEMKDSYIKYVTLGQYKGVEYTPQVTEVHDEYIQYDIQNLLSSNSTRKEVDTGIATMGDTVNIDFVGYIDGEPFDGGDSQGQGYDLTLGSRSFIDDFEDQICGHSPGDAFDVEVTFPDDYGSEDLAGKDALFETTLNYFVETEEPEYNDALVASATDYTTTEEYEQALLDQYKTNAEESDLSANKSAVFNKVIENSTVSQYPETEVNDRIESVMSSVQSEAEANGVDVATYLSNYGYDLDSFKDSIKESVETYIREKMIVVAIANEEKITVTEEEKEAKIQELLKQTGLTDKETLDAQYGFQDDDYYYEVLYSKVIDFVYENAVAVEATNTDAEEADDATPGMVDDYGTKEESTKEESTTEE